MAQGPADAPDVPNVPSQSIAAGQFANERAAAVDLDDNVDYVSDFKFSWEVSITRPATPFKKTSGESNNEFFATLAKPTTPAAAAGKPSYGVMVTPLWAFCREASGSTGVTEATDKAFDAFRSTDFETHKDLDPLRGVDSHPLFYYKEWNTPSVDAVQLLLTRDGQCGAWTNMFRSVLLEGGVPQSTFSNQQVKPLTGSLMLINSWTFSSVGTATYKNYSHINEFQDPRLVAIGPALDRYAEKVAGQWKYKWGMTEEVHEELGMPGQNNTNPASLFGTHYIIRVGDTIYDPSYGASFAGPGSSTSTPLATPWMAACLMWEQGSLAGISEAQQYSNAQGADCIKLAIRISSLCTRDTKISPVGWL